MPPLEGDEEVKEGTGLKVFPSKKLFTRLSILLAQIKAVKNSDKLKIEIREILYLLYQHNKITKKVNQFNQVIIIMEETIILIKDPKTFYFNFDWPKDVDKNSKHKIEFIRKSYESLAEIKIKSEI